MAAGSSAPRPPRPRQRWARAGAAPRVASFLRGILLYGAVILASVVAAGVGQADGAPRGLMWSRTELPRVFPLQVKTNPGADWVVVLHDLEAARDVLSAGFQGGKFFRVLVPPGNFAVTFHSGAGWQGEDDLFGPETETFTFPEPLKFGVSGIGTKNGHLLDLRGEVPGVLAMDRVEGLDFCQKVLVGFREANAPPRGRIRVSDRADPYSLDLHAYSLPPWHARYPFDAVIRDDEDALDDPFDHRHRPFRDRIPRFETYEVLCD